MKKSEYMFGGHAVMRKSQADRFYLDMSVYEVREYSFDGEESGEHPIWRGLYLAVSQMPPGGTASAGRLPLNLWN